MMQLPEKNQKDTRRTSTFRAKAIRREVRIIDERTAEVLLVFFR
jgi:hypothetical protein